MGSASLCGPKYTEVMPKEQFRWQMIFPNNEGTAVPNSPAAAASSAGGVSPAGTSSMPASMPQSGMLTSDNAQTILSPSQTNAALQQVTNGSMCTHWTGQAPLTWGDWLGQPGTGSNYVYLVFQWTDCCMGLIGGSLN